MCKEVEKVLEESVEQDMTCTVIMNGEDTTTDDFVAVLTKEDGGASIFYNTDALTLGLAMKMVARAFIESMSKLSDEEREYVQSVLGEDFEASTEV